MAYITVKINARRCNLLLPAEGAEAYMARTLNTYNTAYSRICSSLKNRKFRAYSGDTLTLCLPDRKKISAIQSTTGTQYPAITRAVRACFFAD